MDNNKQLTKQLIQTANIVRNKYKSLRSETNEEKIHLEKKFKPITKTLEKISYNTKVKEEPPNLKVETETENSDEEEFYTGSSEEEKDEKSTCFYYLSLVRQKSKLLDNTYGIYYDDGASSFKIGSSTFNPIGNNFQIGEKKYIGTSGLFELLFLKTPQNYTSDDLSEYGKILKITNAYKRKFESDGQTKGTSSYKYRTIIKPLITHTGASLMNLMKPNVDYIYWNDPNEMVERLRLLLSSQQAGNNNHDNEITSIVEELRESNIII